MHIVSGGHYVILSTNGRSEYEFFAPIVASAWRGFGWEPVIITHNVRPFVHEQLRAMKVLVYELPDGPFPEHTRLQTSRIYMPTSFPDSAYVTTSDVDMIPLSDFLSKDLKNRVVGWDITGFPGPKAQVPICYVSMLSSEWRRVIRPDREDWVKAMELGLSQVNKANEGRWDADQVLLTQRVCEYGREKFDVVPRRTTPGLGRVCRSAWGAGVSRLLKQPQIDCHALRPGHKYWKEIRSVLQSANVFADWMDKYAANYKSEIEKIVPL